MKLLDVTLQPRKEEKPEGIDRGNVAWPGVAAERALCGYIHYDTASREKEITRIYGVLKSMEKLSSFRERSRDCQSEHLHSVWQEKNEGCRGDLQREQNSCGTGEPRIPPGPDREVAGNGS